MFRLFLKKKKKMQNEQGYALIVVLILLTLGSLIIGPLLSFLGTGAKSSVPYHNKTAELYAADAGIQDAIWQVKYNDVQSITGYSPYEFDSIYSYTIDAINGKVPNISISNEWIPSNYSPAPDVTTATTIIDNAKLVVTGNTVQVGIPADNGDTISKYRIKITYYPVAGETMQVGSIGVWLPPGCTFVSDANHKSSFEEFSGEYLSYPSTTSHKGGEATVWNFGSNPLFEDFPNATGELPVIVEADFYFKPPETQTDLKPSAVAWIIPTSGIPVPISWDADNKIFKLSSTSGSTTVDSYVAKTEVRELASAMGGDYYAIGNSNVSAYDGDHYLSNWNDPTSATVDNTNIPENAQVTAAFLYWTGWRPDDDIVTEFSDDCSDFNDWNNGTAWSISGSYWDYYFEGNGSIDSDLVLDSSIDMSDYDNSLVTISWDQWIDLSGGSSSSHLQAIPIADGDISGTWEVPSGTTQTRVPTADADMDGNWDSSSWGSLYKDVDETSPNDWDYFTGTTNSGGYTLFTFDAFDIPTGATITNVTIYIRAEKTKNKTANIQERIKVNGSYYDGGSYEPDRNNWNTYSYSWSDNPATGSAWTVDDVNGTGSNPLEQIGVYSTDLDPDVRVSMVYAEVEYSTGGAASLYTSVDETTPDDTDYVTGVENGYMLFPFSSFNVPEDATIDSLTVYVRASDDGEYGDGNIYERIKVDGSYYDGYYSHQPGWSYNTYSSSWSYNPATGSAWTVDDINGTGSNPLEQIGVYSNDLNPDIQISMVYAEVEYTVDAGAEAGLYFSFYDGSSWSVPIYAFSDGVSYSSDEFTYYIPETYLKAGFKVKFSLEGSGETVYIDNIQIRAMTPDEDVIFRIDAGSGQRTVCLNAGDDGILGNADDQPYIGTIEEKLESSRGQVLPTMLQDGYGNYYQHGFYYSSYRDVTKLVQAYSTPPVAPDTNFPGYGTYYVGNVYTDTEDHFEGAHACWSLIIVYESQDTLGHQLYLYDDFINSSQDKFTPVNEDTVAIDFDNDGTPGGTISGFIVPPRITSAVTSITVDNGGSGYTSAPAVNITGGGGQDAAAMAILSGNSVSEIRIINGGTGYTSTPTVEITGGGGSGASATATYGDEINVGKITCFVGEGDVWYDGDYLKLNGTKLWDGTNTDDNSKYDPSNTFNSQSLNLGGNDGIDIDTLGIDPANGEYITWDSGLLNPGDTSAQIDLYTHIDGWNLCYIIISFRSTTTTGGALSYLIH